MATNVQKIQCPKCGESISIDDVLTHQIEDKIKKEFLKEQAAKEADLEKRKEELRAKELQLAVAQKSAEVEVNKKVAEKLAAEKPGLWKKALVEAEKNKSAELKMLEEQIKDKDQKLSEVNAESLKLRLDKQKLESDKRDFELEKQRQMDEAVKAIKEEEAKKAAEAEQYKIAQLEKKLSDALRVNEEQKRKLEQGSQQTQGEILELELEELLKREFPQDEILPVPKGTTGADIIQKIMDKSGRLCGQIAWESKKTKGWQEGWIQKLKDDQRNIKADLAVIISAVLPEDIKGFNFRDGVWICDVKLAIALATALRISLFNVARERSISVGKNEKMEILYTYISGVEFRQRVEAIVEAFTGMQDGLKKERLAYEKIWSERDKQIQKVITNTVGMYGDLSGLVTLPQIKMLELEDVKMEIKP
jgi:hypothetical protein